MSRENFIPSAINPYNIGGRAHNKEHFPLPMYTMWEILCDQLHFVAKAFNLNIHQFIMMINHFHLTASCPEQNLSEAMQYFMRETSRTVNNLTGDINQFWGKRYYRSEMTSYQHYLNVYKYNYINPVTAKVVEKVEDYKYSTLSGIIGKTRLYVPTKDEMLIQDPVETLRWLNRPPNEEYLRAIKKGSKHSTFKLPKINSRQHPLEFELL